MIKMIAFFRKTRIRILQTQVYCLSQKSDPIDIMTLLVCPLSKEGLHFDASIQALVCSKSRIAYPLVKDGIINLRPQEGYLLSNDKDARISEK